MVADIGFATVSLAALGPLIALAGIFVGWYLNRTTERETREDLRRDEMERWERDRAHDRDRQRRSEILAASVEYLAASAAWDTVLVRLRNRVSKTPHEDLTAVVDRHSAAKYALGLVAPRGVGVAVDDHHDALRELLPFADPASDLSSFNAARLTAGAALVALLSCMREELGTDPAPPSAEP